MAEILDGVTYELRENIGDQLPMAANKTRSFSCPPDRTPALLAHLTSWASGAGYTTTSHSFEDAKVLQIKSDSLCKRVFGQKLCLNVIFRQDGGMLNVEIGEGAWTDKIAAGIGWFFVFAPFIAIVGVGAYLQAGMDDDVYEQVELFLSK